MSFSKQPERQIQAEYWSNFANKYENTIGVTTRRIAKHFLEQSPPFSNDSVVLDNACGTGIVTEEVQEQLRSQPDVTVKVYAADSASQMVQVFDLKAERAKRDGGWPNIAEIVTHVVPAEDLDDSKIPSGIVTHAYMNFGIFFCTDPLKAARNVYRTLTPGGTAVFTTWADLGYENFLRQTEKTRKPGNENFLLPFANDWKNPEYVASLLGEAGFDRDRVNISQEPSFFKGKDMQELVDRQTELITMLIRGPGGFESDEEKRLWKETLAENIAKDDHFVQDADGVAIRMLANIVVAVK